MTGVVEGAPTGAPACALGVRETAAALERYRRRAVSLVIGGLVTIAVATLIAALLVGTGSTGAAIIPFGIGIVSLGGGIGSLVNARRMRRTLAAGTWSAHPAVAIGSSAYATSVVLRSPDGSEAWPLTVIATRQRYELLRPGPDGVLWWCGDPGGAGVLAPPGGGELIWAKPMRGGRVRRRILARAEAEGLMHRAAPRQPRGPLATLVPVPTPTPVPVPVPVTVDDPYDNPDSGHSEGHGDGLHEGLPEGHGEGLHDSSSVRLDEAPSGPSGPPAPSGPSGPTYAVLAAHARRQAAPQGRAPRPEADVRDVAWWRVRSLRQTAGVTRVLVALGFCAAVGAVALTGPPQEDLLKLGGVGALVLAALVYSCHQLLTRGRHVVRVMVRAATSFPPRLRRYVLLHDPRGGAPVLVLFPVYGGPYARPEAVLPLIPPGPRKEPRRGLPALPVGTVGLHGWQDFTPDGRMPFVVPRIGGRPLWPAGPYWEDDGRPEFAALLDRLAPPLEAQDS
ncbi:hypothetical protein ACFTUC_19335 [Streptomyces sp. NPDC056944]|uniref:hypothetical protein n=1 Tax=Streptomyces sp. NPDC056944 TaxID=3345972 RepID=UPI003630B208